MIFQMLNAVTALSGFKLDLKVGLINSNAPKETKTLKGFMQQLTV